MRGEASARVIVPVPCQTVFDHWTDVTRFPSWFDHLSRVELTGPRRSRWSMDSPAGTVTWETEITVLRPPYQFAWSSVGRQIATFGKVQLKDLGDGRTHIQFSRFHAARGPDAQPVVDYWFGDPQAKIRADLQSFVDRLRESTTGSNRPRGQGSPGAVPMV